MNVDITQPPVGSPPNILVIDDNHDFRYILVHFLRKQGINADSADNGQAGLDKYLENPTKYSAILMDIHMPMMNGYELLDSIRKTEAGKLIPVIAMSGQVDEERIDVFNSFLRKPFPFQMLMPTIIKAIESESNGVSK